jgi:hypothetical protein
MMTGEGPFGSVEMGGMFSVVKVRADQQPNDYSNPGWFKHPKGTRAYQYKQKMKEPNRSRSAGRQSMPRASKPAESIEVRIRKPQHHLDH